MHIQIVSDLYFIYFPTFNKYMLFNQTDVFRSEEKILETTRSFGFIPLIPIRKHVETPKSYCLLITLSPFLKLIKTTNVL